jgi:hypothetical protein
MRNLRLLRSMGLRKVKKSGKPSGLSKLQGLRRLM